MRLVSYGVTGAERPGVLVDERTIAPLAPLLSQLGLPTADMNAVLGVLPYLAERIKDRGYGTATRIDVAATRLGPPVPRPTTVVAVGANYAQHIAELSDVARPAKPVLFVKPVSSLSGPGDDIVLPRETRMLDYECELGVVIGRGGRRIPRSEAMEHIGGFMIANDVTARDVFLGESDRHPLFMQVLRGKGYDTFCPTGPWLVTPDEFTDPAGARLRLWVNDELRQDAVAGDMIFDVSALIASVSECLTLRPGDIILTGSPPGVGFALRPPRFLADGDTLRLEISGLGTMTTRVRDEEP